MAQLNKTLPRLLVISRNPKVRDDLVTLLTGYGYYVDYVQDRSEGISRFRQYKQSIVIVDVPALPRFPQRMFRIFRVYRRNPIVLIAAYQDELERAYSYMQHGVYDVVQLPLNIEYVDIVLSRLVKHNKLVAQNEFMRILILLTVFVIPLWIVLIAVIARYWFW